MTVRNRKEPNNYVVGLEIEIVVHYKRDTRTDIDTGLKGKGFLWSV